jgi:hypothetical protein
MNTEKLFFILLGIFLVLFGLFAVTNFEIAWGRYLEGFAALIAGIMCFVRLYK